MKYEYKSLRVNEDRDEQRVCAYSEVLGWFDFCRRVNELGSQGWRVIGGEFEGSGDVAHVLMERAVEDNKEGDAR